jgi:hypothetical protein
MRRTYVLAQDLVATQEELYSLELIRVIIPLKFGSEYYLIFGHDWPKTCDLSKICSAFRYKK